VSVTLFQDGRGDSGARAHHPQKRSGARRKCGIARNKFAHCSCSGPSDPPATHRVLDAEPDSRGRSEAEPCPHFANASRWTQNVS
jgi:hypothetical protein